MLARRRDPFFDLFGDIFGATSIIRDIPQKTLGAPIYFKDIEGGTSVTFEVPGYSKEDLELTLENRLLTLSGKAKDSDLKYQVRLAKTIDEKTLACKCENGVVTVTTKFVKPETGSKRTIKID